jgi:single-stranded-DNA-specific exonuclease
VSNWNKKTVPKEVVKALNKKFGVDMLTASILIRRGITEGSDILYFLEDDLRFQHSPFLFNSMEDAVDRILSARDEGEKVLIFGDRDVDGIASTTVLYDCLRDMHIEVSWRLPTGDDTYGLSTAVIDQFAETNGTLIITVDCGISNNVEIAYAAEKCIDVIVVDHHNPPEELPQPAIIVNPKMTDSGYPFPDISGCAVVYKLVEALRFSKTELYKQDICLMNVRPVNDAYTIECIKVRNLVEKAHFEETIIQNSISITQTRLLPFLNGQQIFVWDSGIIRTQLVRIFGNNVEFNMMDVRPEITKLIPSVEGKSLLALKDMSRIARYTEKPPTELEGFFNIFVSFIQKKTAQAFPADAKAEEKDLQLVMLAAIADIMPIKNENRIFIRRGLASINAGSVRPGLMELLSRLGLLGKRITSTAISWEVTPVLNAAGRLGHPELAIQMFIAENAQERDKLAEKIIALNSERKQIMSDTIVIAEPQAKASLEAYSGNLCVVIDGRINRGITGILSSRLVQMFNVPAIVVTFLDNDTAVGSMRSCKGYDLTVFLGQFGDLFINHGGHTYAGGFSFKKDRLNEFSSRLAELAPAIELDKNDTGITDIDAELPPQYMVPSLLDFVDKFEPFGAGNSQLVFLSKSLKVADVQIIGKTDRQHLKITFDCGKIKWPALLWDGADRLHRDFENGDRLDVLYHVTRNTFNGMETPQMILTDLRKSE